MRAIAAVGLMAATRGPMLSQTPSAEDVFARFCKLDAQGGQLTHDGWRQIAALFVNPGTPRLHKIFVTGRSGPLGPEPEEGKRKIGVGREYIRLGQIDLPQVRFSADAPGTMMIEAVGMYMVKISGPGGAEEWRIDGPVPEPVVTADAAIRYITEIRANTKDAIIRKNATRTLAALRRFSSKRTPDRGDARQ
jgi:hypothetical protein